MDVLIGIDSSGPSAVNAQGEFAMMNDTEKMFARTVVGYWSGFAEKYDPNGEGRGVWSEGTQTRIVLDEDGSVVEQVSGEHQNRCEFWISVGSELRI